MNALRKCMRNVNLQIASGSQHHIHLTIFTVGHIDLTINHIYAFLLLHLVVFVLALDNFRKERNKMTNTQYIRHLCLFSCYSLVSTSTSVVRSEHLKRDCLRSWYITSSCIFGGVFLGGGCFFFMGGGVVLVDFFFWFFLVFFFFVFFCWFFFSMCVFYVCLFCVFFFFVLFFGRGGCFVLFLFCFLVFAQTHTGWMFTKFDKTPFRKLCFTL